MKDRNKKFVFIAAILLAIAFFSMTTLVLLEKTSAFDNFVYQLLPKSSNMTSVMKAVTFLGEGVSLLGIAVLLVLVLKDKIFAISIPFNLGVISLLNFLLKMIVRRDRPVGFRLIEETGFSFPSGHSASSMAFYGYLIYLIYKRCKNKTLKIVSIVSLSLLILSIGISRIYLGVHYASDVLGGFLLAGLYLIIYVNFIEKMFYIREKVKSEQSK